VDPLGAQCACGSRGCLETLVGQEAIARQSGLRIESGERMRSITAELVRRAEAHDDAVLTALHGAGTSLGLALASAVNLFDLDVVVLGGRFGPRAPGPTEKGGAAPRLPARSPGWRACR